MLLAQQARLCDIWSVWSHMLYKYAVTFVNYKISRINRRLFCKKILPLGPHVHFLFGMYQIRDFGQTNAHKLAIFLFGGKLTKLLTVKGAISQ